MEGGGRMTDEEFRKLCNTFGFAPSRALRELLDCVRAQEIAACAKVCEVKADEEIGMAYEGIALDCAATIRERKDKQ